MTTEIRVPALGESITEATVGQWLKAVGDTVALDEQLAELETDKVTLEVNAPVAGVLVQIDAPDGTNVEVGALLGLIGEGAIAPAPEAPAPEAPAAVEAAPAPGTASPGMAPAAAKLAEENAIDPAQITPTGKGGRITKGDVLQVIEGGASAPAPAPAPQAVAAPTPEPVAAPVAAPVVEAPAPAAAPADDKPVERVRMSRLRKRVAERLKEAQNTAAMLTTFNEVDMTNLMAARKKYVDLFEKKNGIRLGFMSFFVKAAIVALKDIPAVNAEIDGDEIVYKNFYDIGVAVSTPNGLVVPVVRNADDLSFADVEKTIFDLTLFLQ